jgi:hypothetical protein
MIPFEPLPISAWTLGLTFVFEAITLFFRFACGLEWAKVGKSTVGAATFGIRIHHSFVGLAMVAAGAIPAVASSLLGGMVVATGGALFLSDMIHHFLVLWPVTGRAQFDFVYK